MTRVEAEAQIKRYFAVQGQYRQLTRREYRWRTEPPLLPTDSVKSPALTGLPLSPGVPGDPTLRVIMSREEILERRAQALDELSAQIERLQDELLQMVELWAILSPVQRWLLELYYWRGNSQEAVAQWFVRHQDTFDGWLDQLPMSQAAVSRALDDLLDFVVFQWSVNDLESPVNENESPVNEPE